MTVCIAAVCQYEGRDVVICCSDCRLSIPDGIHAAAQSKFVSFSSGKVFALFTGEVTSAFELLNYLDQFQVIDDQAPDYEVQGRIQDRCVEYRKLLVDRYLKLGWGISWREYEEGGASHFPETIQQRIPEEIGPGKIDFECDLTLVCFNSKNEARLFTVDRIGRVRETSASGIAVIGSGSALAAAELHYRNFRRAFGFAESLYYVFEAKKKSEADGSVGSDTYISVVDAQGSLSISEQGTEYLEHEFTARGLIKPWLDLNDSHFDRPKGYQGVIQHYHEGNAKTAPIKLQKDQERG